MALTCLWEGGEKQRGIVTYGIAPNRLNPLAGNGIFNVWRRFSSQVWYFAPPMVAAWYIMFWADERLNRYLNSKAGRAELQDHDE
ncbi:Cytochrome b-c1 complex subunit 8-like protein 2 [Colletotrichum chlorophyti]|uniref:Cytochrome b-c1 complex subunit 8 n=1 Tax=Colletotrichum chlorophyti TaxID=708187 RepID=A0A1Q8RZF7_9PEZI|nr:Cytochrome b-c1 complex subunit 8-like protein 2 [Colletotrichum chlorophyti]